MSPPDSYWRSFSSSRSPSPIGLIPIHQHWRRIVHKHEVPRKLLHVSVGFLTIFIYTKGATSSSIHPWLLSALIPVASLDVLRHSFPQLNRLYVRTLGVLMRESEVNGYNGVIWYLAGAWATLRFMPKDVGVVSILLLSWCDTAASTFGRLYGIHTPQISKGKSLAGSTAAFVVGVLTAAFFWGLVVPWSGLATDDFSFKGLLSLPGSYRLSCTGWLAVGIVGLWSGFVASFSEAIDVFSLDDNITIPLISGLGLWGFFKCFA